MNSNILRLLDNVIGVILYHIFGLFSKANGAKGKKILAIKLWALGESVLILPALKALHASGYKIYVLATKHNMAVFEGHNFIEDVIVLKLNPIKIMKTMKNIRKSQMNICIDFEPYTKFSAVLSYLSGAKKRIGFNNRPKLYTKAIAPNEDMHAVRNFVNLANALKKSDCPKELIPLNFSKEDMHEAEKMLKENGIASDNLVGIHAGSAGSSLSRRWPDDRFAELCDKLIKKYNVKIVLVGSKGEKKINERIIKMANHKDCIFDFSGKLMLKELFALMKKLKLFIANDSGPMHIAAAMGVPTIGLFGPNLPERYGPFGKRNIGIYKGNGIAAVLPFRGKFGENHEINKISVDDVMDAVKKIRCIQ